MQSFCHCAHSETKTYGQKPEYVQTCCRRPEKCRPATMSQEIRKGYSGVFCPEAHPFSYSGRKTQGAICILRFSSSVFCFPFGKSKGMSLRSINSGTLSPIRNVTRASFFSDLLLRSASSRQFFQYFSSFLSIRSVSRLLSLSISFPGRLYENNLACVRV